MRCDIRLSPGVLAARAKRVVNWISRCVVKPHPAKLNTCIENLCNTPSPNLFSCDGPSCKNGNNHLYQLSAWLLWHRTANDNCQPYQAGLRGVEERCFLDPRRFNLSALFARKFLEEEACLKSSSVAPLNLISVLIFKLHNNLFIIN
jgi:hypothetical protein